MLHEATATEQQQVKQWLNNNTSNLDYYNELKKVWDIGQQLASLSTADENKAWGKFLGLIHPAKTKPFARLIRFGWIRIAASVIITLGLGLTAYWLFSKPPVKEIIVQTRQTVLNDTLPDGSVVTVNKGSSISYPSVFKEKIRPVKLKGEAFFNVAPDKKKPFIISVNDVQITVVGTSFNVKSTNGNTEVIVESGIVRVAKAGRTIELKANEKLKVEAKDSVLAKQEVNDHLYNYYRTKEFVCDDTPLWKLVDVLNDVYNTHIVIGNAGLKDLKLNTTFNNESLDQVLNVISLTFNIKVIREENRIVLQ
jgi:ferric-dicitrate binding protein FerR (iron transport regulator)